jgi:hypothetical protein
VRTTPQMVPIVAYHSVADDHDHPLGHLSIPVRLFEQQMKHLRRHGFITVGLRDVYAHLNEGAPLPKRAVALTFDDGYLDNWVFAFPLLKKHSMKATVFVATDFVDSRDGPRPNLEDVWQGRVTGEDLEWWGHLSWPELEAMQASGLMDVQSHTRTHTWWYTGDRIIDFHHPGAEYHWLDWNLHPENKPSWLTRDFRAGVPWGTPVYEFSGALLGRRYFEDGGLTAALTDHVARHGDHEAFFSRPRWRDELFELERSYRADHIPAARYESEDEYLARTRDELRGSKRILEERLRKPVDFLCWPCGDYTEALRRQAIEECGYRATVTVEKRANRLGDDPTLLRRIVFGQDYRGPLRSTLVFMNFCGTVNYESGRSLAYPLAPLSRRLMRLGRLFG